MTCCFIGHRKIKKSPELRSEIENTVKELIESGVTVFLFGDHSEFDSLCHETVTKAKETYPHIRRIHYRTAHPEIDGDVMQYFLVGYEDSVCPKGVELSGKASYIERNRAMIDDSDFCVFYYDEQRNPLPQNRLEKQSSDRRPKSGTALAYKYAEKIGKKIVNCAHPFETPKDLSEE